MAAGTLYTYPSNFRAFKILIAARYSGEEIRVVSEPPEFVLGETNKTASFLEKFPLGKVPAFETTDGTPIYETNAIMYYVASEELHGKTKAEAAQILQFINVADQEILPAACTWVFPTYGIMQFNKQNTDKAKADIHSILEVLHKHLETRTFLVGERVSLADIGVSCTLLMLYQQVLEPEFRALYGNVNRWFTTCINQPQFKAVIGEVELCTKMAQFDAMKFAELQPKKDDKRKDKDEKKKQKEAKKAEKAERKPEKEEKKGSKKEKKAKEEEEEDDDAAVLEPPRKDPFAHLPKSSFVMDDFKRVYSNNDTISVAIPYLWENFDPEGYSFWHCEYKYPEELKRVFMSCNLVGGMFQRLDKLHKHAFASVIIFGEDNNSSISGVWIFRGQQLAFELDENWQIDSPSYDWKKLDPSTEENRKLINEYFAWEGDFGGKAMNQGKIFK